VGRFRLLMAADLSRPGVHMTSLSWRAHTWAPVAPISARGNRATCDQQISARELCTRASQVGRHPDRPHRRRAGLRDPGTIATDKRLGGSGVAGSGAAGSGGKGGSWSGRDGAGDAAAGCRGSNDPAKALKRSLRQVAAGAVTRAMACTPGVTTHTRRDAVADGSSIFRSSNFRSSVFPDGNDGDDGDDGDEDPTRGPLI